MLALAAPCSTHSQRAEQWHCCAAMGLAGAEWLGHINDSGQRVVATNVSPLRTA